MKQKIQVLLIVSISLLLYIFPSYSHEIKKEKIEQIIKNYLIKNPKLIKSTLEEYKKTVEIEKKIMLLVYYVTLKTPVFLIKILI